MFNAGGGSHCILSLHLTSVVELGDNIINWLSSSHESDRKWLDGGHWMRTESLIWWKIHVLMTLLALN